MLYFAGDLPSAVRKGIGASCLQGVRAERISKLILVVCGDVGWIVGIICQWHACCYTLNSVYGNKAIAFI